MLNAASKTPEEIKYYTVDYSCDLLPAVTITNSTFTCAGDVTVAGQFDASSATVTLSGGTAGQQYIVRNVVSVSDGETLEKTFLLYVNADNYVG